VGGGEGGACRPAVRPAGVERPVPQGLAVGGAVFVAALALAGGLAVLAAKRTRRRARLEHAA
jgi:hypothetical protein